MTTEQDDETPESSTTDVSNERSTETSPGPWFDRILGACVCLLCFVMSSNTANYNSTSQTLCYVLKKNGFFSLCLSLPRSKNGFWQISVVATCNLQ